MLDREAYVALTMQFQSIAGYIHCAKDLIDEGQMTKWIQSSSISHEVYASFKLR